MSVELIQGAQNVLAHKSQVLTLMFDEAQTVALAAVLSACWRLVIPASSEMSNAEVQEMFCSFLEVKNQTAEEIFAVLKPFIYNFLEKSKLPKSAIISITADGCGVKYRCKELRRYCVVKARIW